MFFTKSSYLQYFFTYFGENASIHHHDTDKNISFILTLYFLNTEKELLNIKVLNFGIISQLI